MVEQNDIRSQKNLFENTSENKSDNKNDVDGQINSILTLLKKKMKLPR